MMFWLSKRPCSIYYFFYPIALIARGIYHLNIIIWIFWPLQLPFLLVLNVLMVEKLGMTSRPLILALILYLKIPLEF